MVSLADGFARAARTGSWLPLPLDLLHGRKTRGRVHERSLATRLVLVLLSVFEVLTFTIAFDPECHPVGQEDLEESFACGRHVWGITADSNDEHLIICYFGDSCGGR